MIACLLVTPWWHDEPAAGIVKAQFVSVVIAAVGQLRWFETHQLHLAREASASLAGEWWLTFPLSARSRRSVPQTEQ